MDTENRNEMLISKPLGPRKIPDQEAAGLTGSSEMRDRKSRKHSSDRRGRNSEKTDAYQRERVQNIPTQGMPVVSAGSFIPDLNQKGANDQCNAEMATNMAEPDNAADEDANDSSKPEQDQLYGFFDDGLTITSDHNGQDPFDFLSN